VAHELVHGRNLSQPPVHSSRAEKVLRVWSKELYWKKERQLHSSEGRRLPRLERMGRATREQGACAMEVMAREAPQGRRRAALGSAAVSLAALLTLLQRSAPAEPLGDAFLYRSGSIELAGLAASAQDSWQQSLNVEGLPEDMVSCSARLSRAWSRTCAVFQSLSSLDLSFTVDAPEQLPSLAMALVLTSLFSWCVPSIPSYPHVGRLPRACPHAGLRFDDEATQFKRARERERGEKEREEKKEGGEGKRGGRERQSEVYWYKPDYHT